MTFHHLFDGNVRMDMEVDLSNPEEVTVIASGLAVLFAAEFYQEEWGQWLREEIGPEVSPHLTPQQMRRILEGKIAFREK